MAETFTGGDINLRSAIHQFAVSCAHVSKNRNSNHQETSANFQRRTKQRKKTYPVARERPAPLEKTSAGIKLNVVAKQNHRPVWIRESPESDPSKPGRKNEQRRGLPDRIGIPRDE